MRTTGRLIPVAIMLAGCGGDDDGGGRDGGNGGSSRIVGVVTTDDGDPLPGARVTVAAGGDYVDETRSGDDGRYELGGLVDGDYQVGASSLRREYEEQEVALDGAEAVADFELGLETEKGRWTTIGDTEPEYYAGTPSGTLLPDGRVFYCHSTLDAVLVDPETGDKDFAIMSPSSQGCHMQTVLSDGRLLFVGGQNPEDPGSFTNGIPYVKTYDPVEDTWDTLDDLNEPRWYPTLVRLPDERMLICGGGQPPDASRTDTCEIWDPDSEQATPTDSLSAPTEYSPSVLLYSGEVLTTWYPPQIFNVDDEEWRATGNFVQSDRGFPDHSPHSLVMLPDGTPLAVGNIAGPGQIMVEAFDPEEETWSEKAAPAAHRSRPEVVMLPDGRVLAAGGKLEDGSDVPTNEWGQVALTDVYDPDTDTWRELAPMALAREYHAMTLLVPDGRVLTTSGTSNQATGPTTENSVEAFEPPYLFRGIRPTIESLSTKELERGGSFQVEFGRTRAPTAVVLIGTSAVTHWMEGGIPRLLRLDFELDGDTANVTVPDGPALVPSGMYILFVFVDDIPSEGVIVTVPR